MKCKKCGAEINKNEDFCNQCGTKVKRKDTADNDHITIKKNGYMQVL